MKPGKILWKMLKWLLKLAFKLFIILLWGALSLLEVILHHLNAYLKKIIH
jgi:hypothetical protein